MKKKAVLALGGNAILKAGQKGTVSEQFNNTMENITGVIELVKKDYQLVITHGNGPQVGNLLIQQHAGVKMGVTPLPLSFLNAATEGTMGYMIGQCIENKLHQEGLTNKVVTIITQVVIDKDDESFKKPTKPVGPFYTKEEAERLYREFGWYIREDAGRGYRQIVPSPIPKDILQAGIIRELVEEGVLVIACGGGGIPVYYDEDGLLQGGDAVIDKDFASALLANEIEADLLMILTGVDKVAINFGKPNQKDLDNIMVKEAKMLYDEGHFPAGSMGPKIQAAINFLTAGGSKVIITSAEKIGDALEGKTGTVIEK